MEHDETVVSLHIDVVDAFHQDAVNRQRQFYDTLGDGASSVVNHRFGKLGHVSSAEKVAYFLDYLRLLQALGDEVSLVLTLNGSLAVLYSDSDQLVVSLA